MPLSTSFGPFSVIGALVILVSACSLETAGESAASERASAAVSEASDDILVDLRGTPGVLDVKELPPRLPQTRYFSGTFEQPVDHSGLGGPKFSQRFTLLFRSRERPTVLQLSGYGLSVNAEKTDEPTTLLSANRLAIEHRFFGGSTPETLDWSKLDIFQAASDHHRIVEAIRPLLPRKWLSTGGSKGGMTATFHRFFYPDDVWATVAYVAPITYGRADHVYVDFLERVGKAECRDKLKAFQLEILRRRDEVEKRMTDEATAAEDGYTHIGIQKALDYTVTEAPFRFWQYLSSDHCKSVPAPTASTDDLYAFLGAIYPPVYGGYSDATLDFYGPYYYQSATQLGAPTYDYSHIRRLLTPHFRNAPQDLPPFDVEKRFHPEDMRVIAHWVRARGERMIYLYGENDPWSSRPYEVQSRNDSYRYVVPNGNHRSNLSGLPEAEKRVAFDTLSRWMDVPITPAATRGGTVDSSIESPAMWRREHPTGF